MAVSLFRRRVVWCPTLAGAAILSAAIATPLLGWIFLGETYLSQISRVPADVLIVEGWIGSRGIQAAAAEFAKGNYRLVMTTGAFTTNNWGGQRWNYAEGAASELRGRGIPADNIVVAATADVEADRTYEMAVATWRALQSRAVAPQGINVFTRGAHSRRSRVVWSKVFGDTPVGVVSWKPANRTQPWWKSTAQTEDFIKESVAYAFEVCTNSLRFLRSHDTPPSPDTQ